MRYYLRASSRLLSSDRDGSALEEVAGSAGGVATAALSSIGCTELAVVPRITPSHAALHGAPRQMPTENYCRCIAGRSDNGEVDEVRPLSVGGGGGGRAQGI